MKIHGLDILLRDIDLGDIAFIALSERSPDEAPRHAAAEPADAGHSAPAASAVELPGIRERAAD